MKDQHLMNVTIRQENEADYPAVFDLIEAAFKDQEYSDHREQFLVERLRMSNAFVPELSLVATVRDQMVGHILLTKIRIKNRQRSFSSLALAPVTVAPSYQGQNIGGQLIKAAHRRAASLGFSSVVLLGHSGYYPRFGYRPADTFGIVLPFDVPPENCFAIALQEEGLSGVSGTVEYPPEFYE